MHKLHERMFNQPLILSKKNKYIFVGAGASGKDFAKSECLKEGFVADVSFTTRPVRHGETHGETYNYISFEDFHKMIDAGEFIQFNQFGNGHFYGTSKASWDDSSVFIIDPKTCNMLKSKGLLSGKTVVFFDIPEDIRYSRLGERNDSNDDIKRRLQTDRDDFKDFNSWNIIITDPNYKLHFVD
jgi:guanylate kinase